MTVLLPSASSGHDSNLLQPPAAAQSVIGQRLDASSPLDGHLAATTAMLGLLGLLRLLRLLTLLTFAAQCCSKGRLLSSLPRQPPFALCAPC
jgi:hypothetical protein